MKLIVITDITDNITDNIQTCKMEWEATQKYLVLIFLSINKHNEK